MSVLNNAKKPTMRPPMITIVGTPGTGKTTLGGMFPNALFVMTEDGVSVFENWEEDAQPAVLPRLPKATKDELGNQVRSTKASLNEILVSLMTDNHNYKTLVIDSVSTLNRLFEHELCLQDNVSNVAEAAGGFHKGFSVTAAWHADLVYKCEQLRIAKNMAIVFLSHSGIKKMRNRPDAVADYSVHSLDMPDQALSVYVSQSDAVLYLKTEEFVMGEEKNKKGQITRYGRVTSTGERKIITSSDGQVGFVNAKNRYGMPAELDAPQGTNPILQFIKYFNVNNEGNQ